MIDTNDSVKAYSMNCGINLEAFMFQSFWSHLKHRHRFWRYAVRTERESIAYIKSLDLKGTAVLDIGANRGVFTYWLSQCVGSSGNVVAFEAQPELKETIQEVERMFKLTNVDLRMTALSDACGTTTFNRAYAGHGGGSIETDSSEHVESETIEVETTTLDTIKDSLPRPIQFIKCDVEGHEDSVFKGATQLLSEDKPVILVEIHECTVPSIADQLHQLGYSGSFIAGSQQFPISDFNSQPYRKDGEVHRNYIFEFTA